MSSEKGDRFYFATNLAVAIVLTAAFFRLLSLQGHAESHLVLLCLLFCGAVVMFVRAVRFLPSQSSGGSARPEDRTLRAADELGARERLSTEECRSILEDQGEDLRLEGERQYLAGKKKNAISDLVHADPAESIPLLFMVLNDSDGEVVKTSVAALESLGDTVGRYVLRAMVREEWREEDGLECAKWQRISSAFFWLSCLKDPERLAAAVATLDYSGRRRVEEIIAAREQHEERRRIRKDKWREKQETIEVLRRRIRAIENRYKPQVSGSAEAYDRIVDDADPDTFANRKMLADKLWEAIYANKKDSRDIERLLEEIRDLEREQKDL